MITCSCNGTHPDGFHSKSFCYRDDAARDFQALCEYVPKWDGVERRKRNFALLRFDQDNKFVCLYARGPERGGRGFPMGELKR